MTNNDILRRLRFVFNFNDSKVLRLYAKMKREMSEAELAGLLKKEDEEGFRPCDDRTLCQFLDAVIIDKRGLRPGSGIPQPLPSLNHNIIFKKLRIALELKEEDIIAILELANFRIGKAELSALFRNPEHKHYRYCGDQLMRNFIKGLSLKYRGK